MPSVPRRSNGQLSFTTRAVGWRLYLSCATPHSKHWWIESIEALAAADLPTGRRRMILPGSAQVAVKDPVVIRDGSGWHMWVCCHPLDRPGEEDRMTTSYATSGDGISWADHGTVLAPTPHARDARGTRVTTVLRRDPLTVLYDGRSSAEANWYETTGLASAVAGRLSPVGDQPIARSPHGDGAFRYASAVTLPDGSVRFYSRPLAATAHTT